MPPADERPNVVLVVTDDQGYGDLSCHGNPAVETPAMDRLATESARLEDFHVETTCAPTRASLLTGRHKLRTGVWHTIAGRSLLDREETTLAELFADRGYRTGVFGKWHLGDNYPYRPGDRGFEEVFVHGGGGVVQTPDYWGNDYFDDHYFRGDDRTPEPVEGYCTDVWFDESIDFIERHAGEPFFCYLPTNAPHSPRQVPDGYRYDDLPEELARFYGMVENIDDNLGRLRERLDELGIAEETILVFTGDNGAPGGVAEYYNAGMRGQKGSQYEGGHRVHCFVRYPDVIDSGPVDRLTRHYDLLPTLVEYCGLDRPEAPLDGRSLRPLLSGREDSDHDGEWSDRALVVDTQRIEQPEKWRNAAVMTEDWRLIDGEELYAIDDDPGQETDVADQHPGVVDRLRAAYEAWWETVSGEFEPCRIALGHEAENPATLTAHDWHEAGEVPWNQIRILEGPATRGYWAVDIEHAGTYEVELRRWPRECGAAVDAVPDGFESVAYGAGGNWAGEAAAIDPERAELEIGDRSHSAAVPDGATDVTFTIELAAGPTEIAAAFLEADGTERGAYYAYVERLGTAGA